ncbi:YMR114C [Zygosaccharomyces parabailii]|uniref:ZYBA0S03-06568g1_1 n=1 Tax=Zygosaccharomyces bailii (strain CLIB 213 / ATCC 58445 / CBS 680 / BCRC 21525 / NBRC 1098 / NCYC 1416 / NRRL Y-2227) TaxID=1333698 RepID=A0A8J2T4T5_ZYGB2|nr:YMR114C [Zygosaccharomyces parabailii]CDF88989.1 ZYBA0S03-06568g1_1 [Zygosaccharomyces bailii CLIB 213]CDH16073.1 uncharacterized protein ZBAI_07861 [Zygosaccharomyces bailii ISA1307]
MCGRYALAYSSDDLPGQFAKWHITIEPSDDHHDKSYNVAPTAICPVYRPEDNNLKYMRWGLVPHWVKDVSKFKTFRTFNAREESLQTTRMWVQCCNYKRCAIPMSGYYEWRTKGRNKTPFYVTRRDGRLLFLAGMYDHVEKEDLWSFTIITGKAPESLKWLHDRMPVVLEPGSKSWNEWLSDRTKWSQQEVDEILTSTYKNDTMKCYQVNQDVGKTTINEEYLTKPIFKQDKEEEEMTKKNAKGNIIESVAKEEEHSILDEKESEQNQQSQEERKNIKNEDEDEDRQQSQKEHSNIKNEDDDNREIGKERQNRKRSVVQMLSPQREKKPHR